MARFVHLFILLALVVVLSQLANEARLLYGGVDLYYKKGFLPSHEETTTPTTDKASSLGAHLVAQDYSISGSIITNFSGNPHYPYHHQQQQQQ